MLAQVCKRCGCHFRTHVCLSFSPDPERRVSSPEHLARRRCTSFKTVVSVLTSQCLLGDTVNVRVFCFSLLVVFCSWSRVLPTRGQGVTAKAMKACSTWGGRCVVLGVENISQLLASNFILTHVRWDQLCTCLFRLLWRFNELIHENHLHADYCARAQ